MKRQALLCATLSLCAALFFAGCAAGPGTTANGDAPAGSSEASTSEAAVSTVDASDAGADAESSSPAIAELPDGDYATETKTDSSMFHPTACTLHVQNGSYSATITMPGEGFSRLYFGTADEAESAPDAEIYDYSLDDEGKYTFDIPVSALEEELTIAAYGQRRDRWYDHTIIFHSPDSAQAAAA